MSSKLLNWLLFLLLCLIWGSSFILMKLGLYSSTGKPLLSAFQVASMRLLAAGLVLLPFSIPHWKKVNSSQLGYIILSGMLGSFVPAFLFCIAETSIDSGLAGTLNALTPIFVLLSGAVLFGTRVAANKIWGIIIGLTGSVLLFLVQKHNDLGKTAFAGLIILATLMYGINVNMVHQKLKGIASMTIASIAFSSLTLPAVGILLMTGYFSKPIGTPEYLAATGASAILGIMGTAVATVLFYMLMRRGGAVFASLVTYGIPFVALGWGHYYGEQISFAQVGCLLVILAGVCITNLNFTFKNKESKYSSSSKELNPRLPSKQS